MEAYFPHLQAGGGSKDTRQWNPLWQREGANQSEKSRVFTKNHRSPLCTRSWASNYNIKYLQEKVQFMDCQQQLPQTLPCLGAEEEQLT